MTVVVATSERTGMTSDELIDELASLIGEWYSVSSIRELAVYDQEVTAAEVAIGSTDERLRVARHVRDAAYDAAASKLMGTIKRHARMAELDLLAQFRMGSHCTLSAVRDVLHVLVAEHLEVVQ